MLIRASAFTACGQALFMRILFTACGCSPPVAIASSQSAMILSYTSCTVLFGCGTVMSMSSVIMIMPGSCAAVAGVYALANLFTSIYIAHALSVRASERNIRFALSLPSAASTCLSIGLAILPIIS